MKPELKILIYEERKTLKELLRLLDEQYELIINKEVIKLDNIAKTLDEEAKKLARLEIQRRNIMGSNASMREEIENSEDENIKIAYDEIVNSLKMLEIQKEANQTLIKQKLFFTKKMINLIKPNRNIGTYDAYGQVGK
ncbi:MAG: flagellar protein FlgN [Cetobacterium sp.]